MNLSKTTPPRPVRAAAIATTEDGMDPWSGPNTANHPVNTPAPRPDSL